MSAEHRQVKRPRLSLNCTVCRDRKVRCGREQPQCTNCIRMNKTCVYQGKFRDNSTGRVRTLSSSPHDRNITGRCSSDRDSSLSGRCQTRPQPREYQVTENLVHPTLHSLEKSMPGPPAHDGISGWSAVLPDQKPSLQPSQASILPSAYLSVRGGGRVRFIGTSFWGFVAGQHGLSGDFLDKNRHARPGLPPPHIEAMGLVNLLSSLPTKPVSDALLHGFFISVWPITPLIHTVTLQRDFDEFWEWCRNSRTAAPPAKLLDDPTFISLLFAVLFCGASAAPATMWASASLQTVHKEATVNGLKAAYMTSLSVSQDLEHPTYNTLVSTLLTAPFMDDPLVPMRNLVSVSTSVRVAQTMGFHSESAFSVLDPVAREMRRRAWWHIVWLDVQSSISTGLPLCCSRDMQNAVRMVASTRDEDIGRPCTPSSSPSSSLRSGGSVAMIYAIGRFETARLESTIVTRLQNAPGLTAEALRELVTAAKQVHQKIDNLAAKIKNRGTSEKELFPALLNASPVTDPSLYKDDASQPSILSYITRIMLTLLKSDVLILLQKPFLYPPESENTQARKSWTSISQLCLSYLRNYLNFYQVPAFAPYMWSFSRGYGPLQCTFLILIYLLYFRQAPDYQLFRYYLNKMIHHYISRHQSPDVSVANGILDISKPPMPVAIQVLVDLHRRLDLPVGSIELPPSALNLNLAQLDIISNIPGPKEGQTSLAASLPAISHGESKHIAPSGATESMPVHESNMPKLANDSYRTESNQEFIASMSDIEASSSLLVTELDELLATFDPKISENSTTAGA